MGLGEDLVAVQIGKKKRDNKEGLWAGMYRDFPPILILWLEIVN